MNPRPLRPELQAALSRNGFRAASATIERARRQVFVLALLYFSAVLADWGIWNPPASYRDDVANHTEPLYHWTGLNWYVDTHVIDSAQAIELRQLRDAGWLLLQVADTAAVETSAAKDPEVRGRLKDDLLEYPMAMGPMVLGHSQLGTSVLGSDEDGQRISDVYQTLWPNSSFEADAACKTSKGRTRFRDALHVATAIRYGGSGFVTEDGPVLGRAATVASTFGGFLIVSIAGAIERSLGEVARVRRRAAVIGTPRADDLPTYPP